MYIDPHVHCRDGKQAYKETIKHALYVAERAGVTAIFDMPNTNPPVTHETHVQERLELARLANSPVFYGLYMALTADRDQIREAVQTFRKYNQVVGFKLYAGHSVGNIGVTEEDDQRQVFKALREFGYTGIVAVHCEKEGLMRHELWDPQNPITHCHARPPEAETASVKDCANFAYEAGFDGTIHVAHISVPEAVDFVNDARKGMNITCGVTPQHILHDETRMHELDGVKYKVNPPLRPPGMNKEMLERLKNGYIDWVETDHAPHALHEKLGEPYLSGHTVLDFYPHFVEYLRREGFTERQIRSLTFDNPNELFGLELVSRDAAQSFDLASEYPIDFFKEFRIN